MIESEPLPLREGAQEIVISADGKTLTATQSGTNAQGQAVKNVIVAERQ